MSRIEVRLPKLLSESRNCQQCRRRRRHRFNPWVGRIPLEKGMATLSSILGLENPMVIGAWQVIVHKVAKSQT